MAGTPYKTPADVFRADVAVLHAAFTAHTVHHGGAGGCPADGPCEVRRVLREALDTARAELAREEA